VAFNVRQSAPPPGFRPYIQFDYRVRMRDAVGDETVANGLVPVPYPGFDDQLALLQAVDLSDPQVSAVIIRLPWDDPDLTIWISEVRDSAVTLSVDVFRARGEGGPLKLALDVPLDSLRASVSHAIAAMQEVHEAGRG
jgi:hypothetical protein